MKLFGIPEGWRTIGVNVGIAAGTAALNYLAGVNWVDLVGPTWSVAIIAAINVFMRMITTTPAGVSPK